MSSSNSHSSIFSNSSVSSPYEIVLVSALKPNLKLVMAAMWMTNKYSDEAYLDEPIADEAWLEEYHRSERKTMKG